jgi:hypothetical protein
MILSRPFFASPACRVVLRGRHQKCFEIEIPRLSKIVALTSLKLTSDIGRKLDRFPQRVTPQK